MAAGTACKTDYLSGERLEGFALKREIELFSQDWTIRRCFDSVKVVLIVINSCRQIIYANKYALAFFQVDKAESLLGKRPGEAAGCIYAYENDLGCGTSMSCRGCSVVRVVANAYNTSEEVSGEGSLAYGNKDDVSVANLSVNVSSLDIESEKFYVVSFQDIEDSIRKRELERTFFHDIINSSGALMGFVEILNEKATGEIKEDIEFVGRVVKDIFGEIMFHKKLIEAEKNEIEITRSQLNSSDIVGDVVRLFDYNEELSSKKVEVAIDSENVIFDSDNVLVSRIIINMVKNAIEATEKVCNVRVGSNERLIGDRRFVEFRVVNIGIIPEESRLQIFQRNFSTKGKGRGLGTYSMKLFGEKFLGGNVGFLCYYNEINKREETMFYLRLLIK